MECLLQPERFNEDISSETAAQQMTSFVQNIC